MEEGQNENNYDKKEMENGQDQQQQEIIEDIMANTTPEFVESAKSAKRLVDA